MLRLALVCLIASACAAAKPLEATMAPLAIATPPAPKPLERNHFMRDGAGSISEHDLGRVLSSPVYLKERTRVGVVHVSSGYELEQELPLHTVPRELGRAAEASGLFEVATEVSTDWPADRGVGGLRELAGRYRTEYLLLYRHRFVDRTYTNGWAWTWAAVLPLFVAPASTLESAGVLEATLFDVRTGTILFTVFERVRGEADENLWNRARKRRALQAELLERATGKLAEQVVAKVRRLAAARLAAAPAG